MKFTIFIAIFIYILAGLFQVSLAQQDLNPCAIIPEKITDLRPPEFDSALRYKRTYGVEGMDRILEILPLKDDGFIAVGMSKPVTRETPTSKVLKESTPQLYLNRHDKDGKLLWEKRHDIEGFTRVADAELLKDSFLVVANIEKNNQKFIKIFELNGLGEKIREGDLTLPNQEISGNALVLDDGAGAFMLALSSQINLKNNKEVSKIVRIGLPLAKTPKILMQREYLADMPSKIHTLQRLKNGNFIAAGHAQISSAGNNIRMGGWILEISKEGDIVNSFLLPRGQQASLQDIAEYDDNSFIAVGQVIGSGLNPQSQPQRAAWVMRISSNGSPIWQDFLRGSYSYSAERILNDSKKHFQILVNGKSIEGQNDEGRDHARVVTYSPEGMMLNVEAFIEASNAEAFDFKQIGNLRVLAGTAQTGFSDAAKDSLAFKSTYNAWLAALPELELKNFPNCTIPSAPTLSDDE